MPGGNAGALGVEHQFSKADGQPACTLITNAKDSLVIRYYGYPDVLVPIVFQDIFRIIGEMANLNTISAQS